MYKLYVGKTDEGKWIVEISKESERLIINGLTDDCKRKNIKFQDIEFDHIHGVLKYSLFTTPEQLQKVFEALMLLNEVHATEGQLILLLEAIATLAINVAMKKS